MESFPDLNKSSIKNSFLANDPNYSKKQPNSRNSKGVYVRGGTKESVGSVGNDILNNRSVKNNARFGTSILNTSLE